MTKREMTSLISEASEDSFSAGWLTNIELIILDCMAGRSWDSIAEARKFDGECCPRPRQMDAIIAGVRAAGGIWTMRACAWGYHFVPLSSAWEYWRNNEWPRFAEKVEANN